ncbi:CPBP family intramembrane metalloprotease [Parapedobacter sp. ISTM3]|uniref:CPBP family intramembrane glutamic endopeptidase n=1 Tax=Parapedobacter sp. ISTM3 TaxID=2800130 RepID=UPI001906C4ED|nr:CPBP family intramembrane glutamic endopeptidase [Parapedobacter sp. ISTM3]MBK1439842.1 CPBP family intramembrane metalloprotease [Parapedobacter sp. ISTM3]
MISSIKETYREVYSFLKHPTDKPAEIQTVSQKIKRLFSVLAIEIPIIATLGFIIYGIEKLGLIHTGVHKLDTLFHQLPLWKFVLWGVIINPFFEELIFRLLLRFESKGLANYSLLSISNIGKRIMRKIELSLIYLWKNKFHLVFFLSTLLFAISHLSNYEFSMTVLLLSPLLIAPQFITGLLLGYLRVRYNLMLGYFMHVIHNAFFISVSLILINFL